MGKAIAAFYNSSLIETSAKTNTNIVELFEIIIGRTYQSKYGTGDNLEKSKNNALESFTLVDSKVKQPESKKKSCSC